MISRRAGKLRAKGAEHTMVYLWYFLFYGFAGYLLEKLFAYAARSPRRVRKGFLLMPVCPVYGLALCALLALGAEDIRSFWELAFFGGVVATAVEYLVHYLCDTLLGVRFWDYSATRCDVNGRICLPFSIAWGILGALAVRLLQPLAAMLAARIPLPVLNALALVLAVDALYSVGVLLRWGDTELLAPCALRRALRDGA